MKTLYTLTDQSRLTISGLDGTYEREVFYQPDIIIEIFIRITSDVEKIDILALCTETAKEAKHLEENLQKSPLVLLFEIIHTFKLMCLPENLVKEQYKYLMVDRKANCTALKDDISKAIDMSDTIMLME